MSGIDEVVDSVGAAPHPEAPIGATAGRIGEWTVKDPSEPVRTMEGFVFAGTSGGQKHSAQDDGDHVVMIGTCLSDKITTSSA